MNNLCKILVQVKKYYYSYFFTIFGTMPNFCTRRLCLDLLLVVCLYSRRLRRAAIVFLSRWSVCMCVCVCVCEHDNLKMPQARNFKLNCQVPHVYTWKPIDFGDNWPMAIRLIRIMSSRVIRASISETKVDRGLVTIICIQETILGLSFETMTFDL